MSKIVDDFGHFQTMGGGGFGTPRTPLVTGLVTSKWDSPTFQKEFAPLYHGAVELIQHLTWIIYHKWTSPAM